jgi:hypothetical protein
MYFSNFSYGVAYLDPFRSVYHFPRSVPECSLIQIRILLYSTEHKKVNWKEKFDNICLLLGFWQT